MCSYFFLLLINKKQFLLVRKEGGYQPSETIVENSNKLSIDVMILVMLLIIFLNGSL